MKSKDSPIEREIKFAEVELDALRQKLIAFDAERLQPSTFEDNWILDRDNELADAGLLLRLRQESRGARLTFKGPPSFDGDTKVRVEHETGITDPNPLRKIFENLGYKAVKRYQKMREEWQIGGVTIALDHTPIGDFAEFEGPAADTLARRFDLDPSKSERRSYLRLYEDHQAENPDALPDMVFPDRREDSG